MTEDHGWQADDHDPPVDTDPEGHPEPFDLEPFDLEPWRSGVDFPDADAAHAARTRLASLELGGRGLGSLAELAVWTCSVQGQCPPRDFARARAVVIAADHGIAANGVSAQRDGATARRLATLLAGGGAVNVFAPLAQAGARLADLSVAGDTDPVISDHKVRHGSGRIDREDALTAGEVLACLRAGADLADSEIEAGADVLLLGELGIGGSTAAATLVAVLTDTEPTRVIGRGSGIDDDAWIRKCAAIRDARRRGWLWRDDPVALLRTCGGADLAAMTGFILQSATRRIPVVLDGVVSAAAALVAQSVSARVVRWIRAGQLSDEPAHRIALDRMGLQPILELQLGYGEASGSLVALPVLRAANRLLAELQPEASQDHGHDRPQDDVT